MTPTNKPLRILIVDDLVDSVQSLAMLLRLHGHEVFEAYDGPRCLEAAKLVHPHIIILDIGLPLLGGCEVAVRIRQEAELAGTYLIAMTGFGMEQQRKQCEEAGFDHFLLKPSHPDEIMRLLDAVAAKV